MADKIRVGIVGATVTTGGSGWGANAHVPALHALPDYEIKAICTAHEETAKASAAAFGAELAFHNINDMAACPDIDLIAVVVRAPLHKEMVLAGLRGGKAVFCEFPIAVNLAEAEEMANAARERSLRTIAGLQGRSDATIRYARDLVAQGYIGEVLTANLSIIGQAQTERGPGRIWQGNRANGANPMTIAGGHGLDSLCLILGEVAEVSARVTTRIKQWKNTETGETVTVDAPDAISAVGRLDSGAEIAVQVATVMSNPTGSRMEIFGREGTLILAGGQLHGAKGKDALAPMPAPDSYTIVPEGTPTGSPRNVAQAYARFADAFRADAPFDADFDAAVRRHRLLDAMERSSAEGKSIAIRY